MSANGAIFITPTVQYRYCFHGSSLHGMQLTITTASKRPEVVFEKFGGFFKLHHCMMTELTLK
jgi:hypothetical protein